ncbi:hypothetical protein SCHPADRAFT_615849 [Schizopora paradoxa]|uniref:Uncharacterized protein n=1 Tax=Schizopora paradoxa TaxID=27342 RepID=A0A0H2R8T9_9AGAM|nr:hypothetical protein SCHPADRAFT_615849 [Schizopora paradoxa]
MNRTCMSFERRSTWSTRTRVACWPWPTTTTITNEPHHKLCSASHSLHFAHRFHTPFCRGRDRPQALIAERYSIQRKTLHRPSSCSAKHGSSLPTSAQLHHSAHASFFASHPSAHLNPFPLAPPSNWRKSRGMADIDENAPALEEGTKLPMKLEVASLVNHRKSAFLNSLRDERRRRRLHLNGLLLLLDSIVQLQNIEPPMLGSLFRRYLVFSSWFSARTARQNLEEPNR